MKCALPLAALLGACASVPAMPVPLAGDWGGPHAALHLLPGGGTLDYDCAHGTIGPLLVGPGGQFTAQGMHSPQHGGPVRVGEVPPSWPVRYSGFVSGDRMTIEGNVETGLQLGPFELRRGAEPMIYRCL